MIDMVAGAVDIAKTYFEIRKSNKADKELLELEKDAKYDSFKNNIAKARRFGHQEKKKAWADLLNLGSRSLKNIGINSVENRTSV